MEKFTFGKYKGSTVNSIIESQPSYVMWAIKNVSFFTLSDVQKIRLSERYSEWKFYHTNEGIVSQQKNSYVDDWERWTWSGLHGAGYE